jgi:hypothetical protein
MLVLLVEEIYELRHSYGLMFHNAHIKFHKDWFRQVVRGDTHRDTEQGNLKAYFIFSK